MRLGDWKARLTEYLSDSARTDYALGRHDCALFAAGAVAACTGVDPAAAWRGRYSTKTGGLRVLKAAGYSDHVAATAAVLEEIPPAFAAPGDIAVIIDPETGAEALGVFQGEMIYVLRPDDMGLGLWPATLATRAFRV